MLQARGGQHRHPGMWLQAVDHASVIALHKIDYRLGVSVPEEYVPAIATADNILGSSAKEVHSLNGAAIAVGDRRGM